MPAPDSQNQHSTLAKITANPLVAVVLLFFPAIFSVVYANYVADWLYTPTLALLSPALDAVEQWPGILSALFGGNYGLFAMFPFLVLYALPTIIVFSLIIGFYKTTNLIGHLSGALHPYLQHIGIGGDDLVRVVMGFGCNVPAIVSSRSCESCSRGACVSAISFGSACSYQLPATFAVFAAADMSWLGMVYLLLMVITTLIYVRITTPKAIRLANKLKKATGMNNLSAPNRQDILADLLDDLKSFVVTAFPIFIVICFSAAFLEWVGFLAYFTQALAPVMALFNLPAEAATAVVLGSVRKDGIAVGLLNQDSGVLSVALDTPHQVLTAVYLAGVLLPCLVTVLTIVREMQWKFALRLCLKQVLWASGFSLVIAWGGALLF